MRNTYTLGQKEARLINEGNGKGTAGKGGLMWLVAKATGREIPQSQMMQRGDAGVSMVKGHCISLPWGH